MAAMKREIKELEEELQGKQKNHELIAEQLRLMQRQRAQKEEELLANNGRLKQMLEELATHKEFVDGPEHADAAAVVLHPREA